MNSEELAQWFDANKTLLETAFLLERYLNSGGRLLIAEYSGRRQTEPAIKIDGYLADMGFMGERCQSSRAGWGGADTNCSHREELTHSGLAINPSLPAITREGRSSPV